MLRKALDEAQGQQQHQQDPGEHHGRNAEVEEGPSETAYLLRQQQHQHHQNQHHDHHDHHHHHISYAATSSNEEYALGDGSTSYDEDDDEEEEDQEYMLHEWQNPGENNDESASESYSSIARIWNSVKRCFFLVANVENLWDSPDIITSSGSERNQHYHSNSYGIPVEVSRRNQYIVLFWFFILATMYATERTSFYLLAHRSGPFRLFAVEMVTATHAILVGLGMLISAISRKDFQIGNLGIPVVDVGLMALLDTVHLLLVFMTGLHVPPTLTVILVQFTLPLTAIVTQFVHRDGCAKRRCCGGGSNCESRNINDNDDDNNNNNRIDNVGRRHHNDGGHSDDSHSEIVEGSPLVGCGGLCMEHLVGSIVIAIAVLLALCPAIYSIVDPEFFVYADQIPIQTAYNTLLYVSSCIPAAASQLYKEHIFLQYKQPVQSDHLNLTISVFQLIFASIVSPLVYSLQGLGAGDETVLYSSKEFSKNFLDGFRCFLGTLDEDTASNGYADSAECDYSFGLVLLNSFSIISVGVAVDKIINAGATKVMSRGVSAGIIISVICLYSYDMHIPEFNYGPAIDSLNLVCLILLVVGSEIYHRVSLQDATFQTTFPEIENFYDDME